MSAEKDEMRWDIVRDLRKQFLQGASSCELLQLIQKRLGLGSDQRLAVFAYLGKGFRVPLEILLKIGAWRGFEGGSQTDDEIEQILRPAIHNLESQWIHEAGPDM